MKLIGIICALVFLAGTSCSVQAEGLTKALLENATASAPNMADRGGGTHKIKFTNGSHKDGSGTDKILHTAVGDLNGDKIDDGATVYFEDTGGRAAFMRMSVFLCKNGKPVQIGYRTLGDRSNTKSLKITNQVLTLDILTHGPLDSASDPTVRKVLKYRVKGDKLLGPRKVEDN
jgi:hypothetical protein